MKKFLLSVIALSVASHSAFAACEQEMAKFEVSAITYGDKKAAADMADEASAKAALSACIASLAQVSTGTNTTSPACSAGKVYTQYGCLDQGACPIGYAVYNESCVRASSQNNDHGKQGPCPAGEVFYLNQCFSKG